MLLRHRFSVLFCQKLVMLFSHTISKCAIRTCTAKFPFPIQDLKTIMVRSLHIAQFQLSDTKNDKQSVKSTATLSSLISICRPEPSIQLIMSATATIPPSRWGSSSISSSQSSRPSLLSFGPKSFTDLSNVRVPH